ncbi:unnamed protein product, partial [Chrysoparadoxa australica]
LEQLFHAAGDGAVLLSAGGGKVGTAPRGVLSYNNETRELGVESLSGHSVHGDMSLDGHAIREVSTIELMRGGGIKGLSDLEISGYVNTGELKVVGDTLMSGGLQVGGSVMGSGPYLDSSDARFKRDVTPIGLKDALSSLMELEAVTYTFDRAKHPEKSFPEGEQIGFLAQDVQEVFPSLTSEDQDGFLTVAYARLVPVIVAGTNALAEEAEDLRSRVASLERQMEAVLKQLQQLEAALG